MEKKTLAILILVLSLAAAHAIAPASSSSLYDDDDELVTLAELENLDVEVTDETEEEALEISNWKSQLRSKVVVNVDSFGAVGDGVSDDTQAFLSAWDKACSTPKSVFLVPEGRNYLVKIAKFKGPCASNLIIQIDGTIVAPGEPNDWDPYNPRIWITFSGLKHVTFQGSGVIDGSGSKWWDASCKRNSSNPCQDAPTALSILFSSSVKVRGLTIQNSQQEHFNISNSHNVRVLDVKISAPESSPNTDGIHLSNSTHVLIQNCKIGTGDDCISIVNGSSHIKIKNIYCGPGHGISIGSLGKDNSTGIVNKVILDTAILNGTTNGLRIKTWQGGFGYVRGVCFKNVRVENIKNPIIIDQFYCDSSDSCANQTSAVEVSHIIYRNISGTTNTTKAIKFTCSDTAPCKKIFLTDINLEKKNVTTETFCNSVMGSVDGYVHPSADCLLSSKNDTPETESIRAPISSRDVPN